MTDVNLSARDRILHTACKLFYKYGVRATGIDRIIKDAGVTKVTFYRHFPAKDNLILAFLNERHRTWMAWFRIELARQMQQHGSLSQALPGTLARWFMSDDFRGCAFINASVELAYSLPEALPLIRQHKQELTQVIASYLPGDGLPEAQMLTLIVDGAIVMAQRDENADQAIRLLHECIKASVSLDVS